MTTSLVDATPKIYFLDLEVDHVPVDERGPRRCITQIALYDPSREVGKRIFEAYVNPPKQLTHKSEEISFNPEQPQKAKYEFSVVWPKLKEWVNQGLDGNRFAVIVGHNMYEHDWKILEDECARIKEAIPKYWKPFDSLYLASAIGVPLGEKSLSSLCQKYNVAHLKQHVASNDVKMLVDVFNKMTEGADIKKVANAMVLPADAHPVKEVATLINKVNEAVLVFFDFESTGLFPEKGQPGDNPRATELGAYIPSKNLTFDSLIDPGLDEGIRLSEKVVEITHITEAMIREARESYKSKTGKEMNFKSVWQDFEAWMEKEVRTNKKIIVLAGHNIWGYDIPLYDAECERFGMGKKKWKSMDTCVLSRHLYKGLKPQPKGFHSLKEIGERLDIKNESAHRAYGDVIANSKIWDKFVEGLSKEKIGDALLSGHPILATGQIVKDEGKFDASKYMVNKHAPVAAPAAPAPIPSFFKLAPKLGEEFKKPTPVIIEAKKVNVGLVNPPVQLEKVIVKQVDPIPEPVKVEKSEEPVIVKTKKRRLSDEFSFTITVSMPNKKAKVQSEPVIEEIQDDDKKAGKEEVAPVAEEQQTQKSIKRKFTFINE